MTHQASDGDLGVNGSSRRLNETLREYIEAQYHIRNEALIDERHALLKQNSVIFQEPYVESTPVYEIGRPYKELRVPSTVHAALDELTSLGVGVFKRPYTHQAEALEVFLSDDRELVIATGTGSGKTESFLLPVIGSLVVEGDERSQTADMPGCRALLLYPMNALVNDQLSRIRRLFGDPAASKIISRGRNRPIRFATYTGRTPYPGKRSPGRDSRFIQPLFDEYYLKLLQEKQQIVEMLNARGKWPSKDLDAFFGRDLIEQKTFLSKKKQGKPRNVYHWRERLHTSPADRELLTRDEVQTTCPDLLVTNYSMLEYMLMRPIERSIFRQTKTWLEADERNTLTLVLDEAHLYYGAAGAEVALLIRRLMARLEIPRTRLRCILTSASLGDKATPELAADFAEQLTGSGETKHKRFAIITGTEERRHSAAPGGHDICEALARVDIASVERCTVELQPALTEIGQLSKQLAWAECDPSVDEPALRDYLYQGLTGFPPAEFLISASSGSAVALETLAHRLFPEDTQELRLRATAGLLSLCTLARRSSDGKVLLPARLHLFFRGLPGLWACSDPECSDRLALTAGAILGRLYTEPRLICECKSHARVYELYTHRDCGTAYITGYISGYSGRFLWNEKSRPIGDPQIAPVSSIELLVDGPPHPEQEHGCRLAWLDLQTGRLDWREPHDTAGYRKVWAPGNLNPRTDGSFSFGQCPVCLRSWRDDSTKIMDHQTKGEDPFASLVAAQLRLQPPVAKATVLTPNAGRKVLLFSDGRQKAARLARDIPRAVEQDVFRQALAVAAVRLNQIKREAKPNNDLYVAFLKILCENNLLLFDGPDRDRLSRDLRSFTRDFKNADLRDAIADFASDVEPPQQYTKHLLRQICGRLYSLADVTVGYLEPTSSELSKLTEHFSETASELSESDVRALSICWIGGLLESFSFNARIQDHIRQHAAGYPHKQWGARSTFDKAFRAKMIDAGVFTDKFLLEVEELFCDSLAQLKEHDGYYIEQRKIKLTIDLDCSWYQCGRCTTLAPVTVRGRCINCGDAAVIELSPIHSKYITARKGYWRGPVRQAIDQAGGLKHVAVEEHTAQLSHRDKGSVHATTERFELRFQDLLIDDDRPIDVLSCTTTMEVGIDIGSLLAVGLRNVPPQRSNYQQRAGRTGRRGSAVSTVLTYAQNGPHDSYYFHRPWEIISGAPRTPRLKIDNPKIARRHLHSYLFQTFFNEAIDNGQLIPNGDTSALDKALGRTDEFFHRTGMNEIGLRTFSEWLNRRVVADSGDLRKAILTWIPTSLKIAPLSRDEWVKFSTEHLIKTLEELSKSVPGLSVPGRSTDRLAVPENSDVEEETELFQGKEQLLDFLFQHNLLPSYAFPTNLAGFLIEEHRARNDFLEVAVKELPQQSLDKALSEYAPGRLVVVNKHTYRSGGVTASVLPNIEDRAAPLFENKRALVYCTACTFVQERLDALASRCPVCASQLVEQVTIQPEVFLPERARAVADDDRDQEITYATMAQFPVPVGDDLKTFQQLGDNCAYTYAMDRKLITVNKGQQGDGGYSGFLVCNKCGAASLEGDAPTYHDRPYLRPQARGKSPRRCTGEFERVFLANEFHTDLLLLRFEIKSPLIHDTNDAVTRHILEDALYTISEALVMAAARHPELDLDQRELGSGFRVIPTVDPNRQTLDVYLYDTSSGGAGYAEMAALYAEEIARNAIELLEHCPSNCDRSCQECLRHYYNQYFQHRLDRKLGAQFLRYALDSTVPPRGDIQAQAVDLTTVDRYLSLEGRNSELLGGPDTHTFPLIVSDSTASIAVGTYPGLLEEAMVPRQSWEERGRQSGVFVLRLNQYMVGRNLPDAHRQITQYLATIVEPANFT